MKFSKLKMVDNISTHGLIYFNNYEQPIGGRLEYNDNQITLTFVIERFLDTLKEIGIDIENIKFVTSMGEYLEIRGGIVINSKNNSNNITTIEVLYQYILVDLKPMIEEETSYDNFKINCSYFKKIFNNSPFTYKRETSGRFHSNVEVDTTSSLEVRVESKGLEVKDFIRAYEYNFGEDYEMKIDYTPYLSFSFEEPLPFNEIISMALKTRNIISFVMDHRIKVEELYISKNKKAYKVFWANEYSVQVPKASHQLIFDIKPFFNRNFKEIISGYFLNEDKLTDIFETYVNNIYRPIYEDDYLVSHIIILEGLHRRFLSNKKDGKMRIRLEEILETLGSEILDKICKESEIENLSIDKKFISYLVKFRNYHSHFFDAENKPSIEYDKLEISKVLRNIIKEFIYLKIDVGESYILSKSGQYSFERLPDFKK